MQLCEIKFELVGAFGEVPVSLGNNTQDPSPSSFEGKLHSFFSSNVHLAVNNVIVLVASILHL